MIKTGEGINMEINGELVQLAIPYPARLRHLGAKSKDIIGVAARCCGVKS